MELLGIIGGIGSGKSTVSALFRQLGAAIISADTIGHQVLRLSSTKRVVRERWGESVFDEDDEVDRRKLAAVVFADKKELAHLQSLTHPLIIEEVDRQRNEHEQSGVKLCVLDAPLLLESGLEHLVGLLIFVSAPAEVRWQRVKERGWSESEWKRRELAQLPVEEKSRRAHIVIDNSGDHEQLRTQVEAVVDMVYKRRNVCRAKTSIRD